MPWYWGFYQFGTTAALSFSVVGAVMAILFGAPQAAKLVVTAGLATAATVAAGTAGLAASASCWRIDEILPPMAVAVAAVAISAAVAVAEAVLAPLCACCCVILLSAVAVHYSAHTDPWTNLDSAAAALVVHVGLLESVALLAFVIKAIVAHRKWRLGCMQATRIELAAHASVMAALAVGDSGGSLPVARELLDAMMLELPAPECILSAKGNIWWGKWRVGRGLGPLLARAVVAAPLLRRKAEEWALLSHGCFPVSCSSNGYELIEWSWASRKPELAARICWSSILEKQDALLKLGSALATSSMPSRHVDQVLAGCCRVGIYFRDVGGIVALLETLRRDPEARIVSCSSRLGPSPIGPAGVPGSLCVRRRFTFDGGLSNCVYDFCQSYYEDSSCRDGEAWCVTLGLLIESDLSRRLVLDSQVYQLHLYLAPSSASSSGSAFLVCFSPPAFVPIFKVFCFLAIFGHCLYILLGAVTFIYYSRVSRTDTTLPNFFQRWLTICFVVCVCYGAGVYSSDILGNLSA